MALKDCKIRKRPDREELLTLAKENGMELTEEKAAEYFAQLNKSGELSDEELDNVAGGGCHNKDGRLVVTVWYNCSDFTCKKCGRKNTGDHFHLIDGYRTTYM